MGSSGRQARRPIFCKLAAKQSCKMPAEIRNDAFIHTGSDMIHESFSSCYDIFMRIACGNQGEGVPLLVCALYISRFRYAPKTAVDYFRLRGLCARRLGSLGRIAASFLAAFS